MTSTPMKPARPSCPALQIRRHERGAALLTAMITSGSSNAAKLNTGVGPRATTAQ